MPCPLVAPKIFLFTGASNADRSGLLSEWPSNLPGHPDRICSYDWNGRWQLSPKEPLGTTGAVYPPVAVGPMLAFADSMCGRRPDWNIAVVPGAVGGSSADEWQKGETYYQNALARLNDALADSGGMFCGVIDDQGQADSSHPLTGPQWKSLKAQQITDFRADKGLVPWVKIEMGVVDSTWLTKHPYWNEIRAESLELETEGHFPHYRLSRTQDLPFLTPPHWATAQHITNGIRAAAKINAELIAMGI